MQPSGHSQSGPPDPSGEALPPGISRRGFLRSTAGGGAAIALASVLPAGCSDRYPAADSDGAELEALTAKEYAVARAAAEALLVDVPVEPAVVARRLDRQLAGVGDPVRSDMKTVLGLLEHLTFLDGRVRRFTELAPEQRLHYLRGWGRSRFNLRRAVFQATRGFIYFFTYADDATRPITGFKGAWPERYGFPAYPVDFGEVA